jgi:hypothetical protein
VSSLSAILLFPFVPSIAARSLQSARWVVLLPVLTTAAAWIYLLAGGASAADAGWAAATVLRLYAGLILGGVLASWIGARIVGRTARLSQLWGAASVAGAWAPLVFLAFLWFGNVVDAAAASALYAGIAVLIWGVAAGFGIISGDAEPEAGRLLVASCLGIGGSILGVWAAHEAPPRLWVRAVPAPVSEGPIEAGRFLLIRTNSAENNAAYLLLSDPASTEAVLVRRSPSGVTEPVGEIRPESRMIQKFDIAGRVFFQIGGSFAGSVSDSEQRDNSSRNRTFYRFRGLPRPRLGTYN